MQECKYSATLSITNNTSIGVTKIVSGIDDYLMYQYINGSRAGETHRAKIRYGKEDNPYVIISGIRYYLAGFMRTGI